MEPRKLSQEFEEFVADVFRQQEGFRVEPQPRGRRGEEGQILRPDIIVTTPQARAIVEVKLWRSSQVANSLILQALEQVERYKRTFEAPRGVLVVSTTLDKRQKDTFSSRFPTTVIHDLNVISFLVANNKELTERLNRFAHEILAFSPTLELNPEPPPEEQVAALGFVAEVPPPEEAEGNDLCQKLKDIPTGRKHWRNFEQACAAALKYIFEDDLTGWEEQKRTESGLSIYDTVCRVVPRHDLWKMLVDQFQSRYIIFEFKNYTNKIKQGQIYTTEKYLFKPALRAVAIIVSRTGPDNNASVACGGALREHGKLILNLTVQDICDMLHEKDAQNDPNSVLMSKIDDMLMRLER